MKRRCEVCNRRLSKPAHSKTGVCTLCRMGGAEFARRWMVGLSDSGLTSIEIASVIGTTPATVRSRLSDMRVAA